MAPLEGGGVMFVSSCTPRKTTDGLFPGGGDAAAGGGGASGADWLSGVGSCGGGVGLDVFTVEHLSMG